MSHQLHRFNYYISSNFEQGHWDWLCDCQDREWECQQEGVWSIVGVIPLDQPERRARVYERAIERAKRDWPEPKLNDYVQTWNQSWSNDGYFGGMPNICSDILYALKIIKAKESYLQDLEIRVSVRGNYCGGDPFRVPGVSPVLVSLEWRDGVLYCRTEKSGWHRLPACCVDIFDTASTFVRRWLKRH